MSLFFEKSDVSSDVAWTAGAERRSAAKEARRMRFMVFMGGEVDVPFVGNDYGTSPRAPVGFFRPGRCDFAAEARLAASRIGAVSEG